MIIVPYSTDAPLYHLPFVTIGVIVANLVIFCMTTLLVMFGNVEMESIEWLMIEFDQINPLQWLTGNFMHEGIVALLGNMCFLFAFGLVVEGKCGNSTFLMVYTAMCLVAGAVTQIPMYFLVGEGVALGASSVIFGLMVMAVFWAPENEISWFWLLLVLFGTFEVRIITVVIWFIAWQLLFLALFGFSILTAMLHIIGVLVGLPFAVLMLRQGVVDCEGWDIVSRNEWLKQYPLLYSPEQRERDNASDHEVANPIAAALAVGGGDVSASKTLGIQPDQPQPRPKPTPGKRSAANIQSNGLKKKPRKKVDPTEQERLQQSVDKSQNHPEFNRLAFVVRQNVQSGNLAAAQQAFQRLDSLSLVVGMNEQSLMNYAMALANEKKWIDTIRPLAIIIEKRGMLSDDACLRIAQIQLKILRRPDQAIKTLEKIQAVDGIVIDSAKQQRLQKRDQLLQVARQQV